jgi:patatin-like phospholipase/acyl hydrolase
MAERKLRLLCLDGGGVRGLSSLFILKQLMETVNPETPPKPCNYFDMIAGTSTGGWVYRSSVVIYVLNFHIDLLL